MSWGLIGASAIMTGGMMLDGGKGSSKAKLHPQVAIAMDTLRKIAAETPSPEFFQPKEIAGKSILEQITGAKATEFVTSPMAPELGIASEAAGRFATTPVDITQLPEYKGILADITQGGNIMANRIAQSLQMKGAATTASGRDVLGRHVTTTSQQLAGALAPFAEAERGRQFAAIPLLAQIAGQKEISDVTKIGVGTDVGSLDRMIQQAINDAMYEAVAKKYAHEYQIKPAILGRVTGAGAPATVTGGDPSMLTQAAPLVKAILPAILNQPAAAPTGSTPVGTTSTGVPGVYSASSGWMRTMPQAWMAGY